VDLGNVTVATTADSRPPFDEETVVAFESLERFGGALRAARRRAFFIGGVPGPVERRLADLGVEVRVRDVVDERFRFANKLHVFDPRENGDCEVLVALDSDVVVAGDFSEHLDAGVVQAKQVDGDGLTFALWQRLFDLFGVRLPAVRFPTSLHPGGWTHAYFNSGVLVVPGAMLEALHGRWAGFLRGIIDRHEELPEVVEHMRDKVPEYHESAMAPELRPLVFAEQWALSLAIQDARLPYAVLPLAMNFPVAYSDDHVPGRYLDERLRPHAVAPLLLHHHHCVAEGLPPTGYREPDRVIETVNDFLRERAATQVG
jgi:hypothetical protein